MQIIELIKRHKIQSISLVIFIWSNIRTLLAVVDKKKCQSKIDQLKKEKIISFNEAFNIAEMNKKGSKKSNQQFLIKLYPLKQGSNNQVTVTKNIRSNELWQIQPSLNKIANQITDLLNKVFIDKDQKAQNKFNSQSIKSNLKWIAKTQSENQNSKILVNGFGHIVDPQIFDVKYKYKIDQKRGFFKSIYQNYAYWMQQLLFLRYDYQNVTAHTANILKKKEIGSNQNRSPIIKGPVIGTICYFLNFLMNRPLLLHVKIQDGKLYPLMISSSRQKMLEYFQGKVSHLNWRITFSVVISLYAFYYSQNFAKKVYRQLKKKIMQQTKMKNFFKPLAKQFKPLPSQLNEDENRLCIICYSNCRNTILFDCRHLILCSQCISAHDHKTCPLCIKNIDIQKTLHQIDERNIRNF